MKHAQGSLLGHYALAELSPTERQRLEQAFDLAAKRGTVPYRWLGAKMAARLCQAGFFFGNPGQELRLTPMALEIA